MSGDNGHCTNNHMSGSGIKYRADIDGLRAIAVLSVFIHHLNASVLPGGFIGVDIFFVISGYLITSQILKDFEQGTFSLKQFYKRRINRIVPALVTVLIVSITAGLFLLSPADLTKLVKSAFLAMIGLSNIFFWREYGNYFAGNAAEAPLLHTWTLGVEEQFYLIWPVILIFLFKLLRKHLTSSLFILAAAGVLLSQIAIGIVASASYYLLPTRFFELMVGGLLAQVGLVRSSPTVFSSRISFTFGMLLILGSLFLLSKSSPFPGINAFWPCLGAALLIWSGTNRAFYSPVLSSRLMVFFGLISYSLYLWHWPIIAYLNYTSTVIRPVIVIAVFVLATLLAWLSWRYIETPMRRSGATQPFSRTFSVRFVLPVATFIIFLAITTSFGGFPQRYDPSVARFELALESKPEVLRSGCHVPTALYKTPPNPDKCRLGAAKADIDGVLIGDSYANHFTGMVDILARVGGISLMDYTMDACPPIRGYSPVSSSTYAERCIKRNEDVFKAIKANRYKHVVLAGNWPDSTEAGIALKATVEEILSTGSIVTLIVNNESIEGAYSCPIRKRMYGTDEACSTVRRGPVNYLTEILSSYPLVRVVDPNMVICKDRLCDPIIEDTLLYRDAHHLNYSGSRLIGQLLLEMGVRL